MSATFRLKRSKHPTYKNRNVIIVKKHQSKQKRVARQSQKNRGLISAAFFVYCEFFGKTLKTTRRKKSQTFFFFSSYFFLKLYGHWAFVRQVLCLKRLKRYTKKIANKKVLVKMTVRSNVDIQSSWKNA